MAQPVGGQVVAGSATISQPSIRSTLITQSSAKAIIDWQQFSLANGQSVQFAQPDASSITLNRVTGGAMSTIAGSIAANGQVWLINPNGVLFGSKALVNVGGLLATTSDIANGDFLSGNYAFGGAPSGSAVVNKGVINASTGGSVVLSAPRVINKGVITAHAGHVVLGSAKAFTVDFAGDHLLSYQVRTTVADTAQADGTVAMTQRAARKVQRDVVNDSGMAEATHVRVENGEVILDGDGVASSGTVDVSAPKGQGGTVELQGKTVNVSDGAKIDASGDAGGGTVLIGGNFHGAGPQLNAQATTVGKATITADATGSGNGGNIAVWSDGTTKVAAAISAKGGAQSGNGGQVETSGHTLRVDDVTTVSTAAPYGTAGEWLLDPGTINISTGGNTQLSGGNYLLTTDNSTTNTVTIDPGTISTALGSGNVRLEAAVQINVSSNLTYSSANSLSLLSQGGITVTNAAIQNAGTGAIMLTAGWDGNASSVGAATAGSYGLNNGAVILQGANPKVGSAGGATYVNAYGLSLQDSNTTNYAQLGYHGAGGGDITVQTLAGGIFLNESYGGVTQIGNGGYDGTILNGATGNITIINKGATTVSTTMGTAKIGNYAGGNGELGNVSLTTGTLTSSGTTYDVNNLITDNIGSPSIFGGDVTVMLTAASGATNISALASYSSSNNVTLISNNTFTLSGVSNTGLGSLSLASGTAFSTSAGISLLGNLNVSSSGGDVTLSGVLNIGGTTAVSSSTGAVALNNTANTLNGTVSAAAYGGTFGGSSQIEIHNSTNLTLGNLTVSNSGAGADYGAISLYTTSTNGAGDMTLTGSVSGGGLTLQAAGALTETGAGALLSHKTGDSTGGGGLALSGSSISLLGTNISEQADDGFSLIAPGQLVFASGGNVAINMAGGSLALYGAYAGGTLALTLTGNYTLNTTTVYDSLDIYNPISATGRVTLSASGNITQKVDASRDVSVTTPVGLSATSTFGSLLLNDAGNGINAGNVTAGQVIDAGNNIGGSDSGGNSAGGTNGGTNVNGYTVLNAPAGNVNFANTRDTILGGPAYYNSPNVPNYVYTGTPTALPNSYTSPDSTVYGTLTVNITDGHQANGHSALILAGRIHAQNRGSTDNVTNLIAAGNIENNAGSGTAIAGYQGSANNLALSSTYGDIGVNDGSNWSFGLGVDSGVLNLKAAAANQITLNPGAINFGIHNQSGPAISTTSGLLVFGNGTVTQSSGFSGNLVVGGSLDVHALGAITLDNPQNQVTGTAFFRTASNITFNNSVNTTIGRANAGGLDANNRPLTATNVTITVADPADQTMPTLTLANSIDTGTNNVTVPTSIDASGTVILSAYGGITDNFANTISTAGHVAAGGTFTATASRQGGLSFTNPANAVTGLVSLTSQDAASFTNSIATLVGTSSSANGTLTIVSTGDLTIDSSANLSSGYANVGSIVLATQGRFINNAGSGALSLANDGGFQIFSNDPSGDTFGNLDSGNGAVWNTTYAGGIDSNANPGNRYAFAIQPTFIVTTTNVTKALASDDVTTQVAAAYTTSGLQGVSGAFQDSFYGAPSVTSSGSAPSTDAPGTTYTINATSGSLSLPTGYAFSASNAGILNIAGNAGPLPYLTYVANPFTRGYGSANPVFTGTVTGFQGNDTQKTSTTGTLTFTSTATASSNVGSYAINGSGLSSNSYQFQQAASNATALTINAALLSYVASANSKTYGAPNPFLTGTVTGFVNGDTQASATTGTLAFSSPATLSDGVGTYAVNGFGLSAQNYVFTQAASNSAALTVNPATLSYVAAAVGKTYGAANPALFGSLSGFVNGDTQSATTGTLTFTTTAGLSSGVGKYAITGSGLSARNYVFAQASGNSTAFTINPATLTYFANPVSVSYGTANLALGGTVTGFVNGDSQSTATTGSLRFDAVASPTSGVGSYLINGSGLLARNYVFVQSAANFTALTITPAILTAALTGTVSKTFDGTTTATLAASNYAPLSGILFGDAVTLSSLPTSGSFDSATAGTGKVVTVTGLTLAGNSKNYVLASATVSAPIGIITAVVTPPATNNTPTTPITPTLSTTNPALLSVTVTTPQVAPLLQTLFNTSGNNILNTTVPAPTQAPTTQIASLTTTPNPIETLTASGGNDTPEPPAPADTATSYIVNSLNGSGAPSTSTVIIPGILTSTAGTPPPPPPGTGENLSAWGNPSLWQ